MDGMDRTKKSRPSVSFSRSESEEPASVTDVIHSPLAPGTDLINRASDHCHSTLPFDIQFNLCEALERHLDRGRAPLLRSLNKGMHGTRAITQAQVADAWLEEGKQWMNDT